MHTREKIDPQTLLVGAKMKVTKNRVSLVSALASRTEPITVSELKRTLAKSMDKVTIYRTLEQFVIAGLVARVDFQHDHAHYELAVGRKHHHHIICTECGASEDIDSCHAQNLEKKVLRESNDFTTLTHHSLEFFGHCNHCQVKIK